MKIEKMRIFKGRFQPRKKRKFPKIMMNFDSLYLPKFIFIIY